MADHSMPTSLYGSSSGAIGAFQGVQLGTGIAPALGMTDPAMPKPLYDANTGALGALQGVQLGGTGMSPPSNMMAPALGTPLTWALASSGVSLEDVLRYKILSTQQQLGLPPGFNTGDAGMQQMPQQMQQMTNSLPSPLMSFPFLASMTSATNDPVPPNRDMASSSIADEPQSGVWRAASGYEHQVSVLSRSRGVDRRVLITRELLSTYFHESLDTVAEKMKVSKTTIKAACRRLGLVKWPYRHSGPRKMRRPSESAMVKQEENGESRDEKEKEAGEKRDRNESESADDKDPNESMEEDEKHAHESESESGEGRTCGVGGAAFGDNMKVMFHALLDPVSPSGSDSGDEESAAHKRRYTAEQAQEGLPVPKRRKVGEGSSLVATQALVEMKVQSRRWCQALGQAHAAREAKAANQDKAIPVLLARLPYFLREADWSFLHHLTKRTTYFSEGLVLAPTTRTSSTPGAPPREMAQPPASI